MAAATRALFLQDSRHDPLARQRQIADTGTERMGDGIADRGGSGASGDFADTERGLVPGVDEFNFNLWHLAELQHRVGFPVERSDAVIETDLLFKDPARRLDNAAFELVDDPIGVDHKPGVARTPDTVQADL